MFRATRVKGSLCWNLRPISHTAHENVQMLDVFRKMSAWQKTYTLLSHYGEEFSGQFITFWLDSICFTERGRQATQSSPEPRWSRPWNRRCHTEQPGVRKWSNLNNFTIWRRGSGAEMAKDGMVAGERRRVGEGEEDGGRERRKAHSCSLSYVKPRLFFLAGD